MEFQPAYTLYSSPEFIQARSTLRFPLSSVVEALPRISHSSAWLRTT
jgi:hypothetical protein